MKLIAKITYELEYNFDVPEQIINMYQKSHNEDLMCAILEIGYDDSPIPCDIHDNECVSCYDSCITSISDEDGNIILVNK